MKILLLKSSVLFSVLVTASHFFAHGYLFVEGEVRDMTRVITNGVTRTLAAQLGYEVVQAVPQGTAAEIVSKRALSVGINPALARSLMRIESAGNPYAVSPVGAIGVMQVMPANAKRCGLAHAGLLFDLETNVRCGLKIFKEDLIASNMDPVTALQRYNGGPKCVGKCQESINHSRKVLARLVSDMG